MPPTKATNSLLNHNVMQNILQEDMGGNIKLVLANPKGGRFGVCKFIPVGTALAFLNGYAETGDSLSRSGIILEMRCDGISYNNSKSEQALHLFIVAKYRYH